MALLFDLDAHGRLVPAGDETRRALADRAGRFSLLPAAPDLLVARRTPGTGGAAEGPRCVVAGDLGAVPIADFLGFVHGARLSGTLTVSTGAVDRAVAFRDGEVRGAHSEAPGERVGEVALRLGLVTRAQLDEVEAGGRPFGRAMVEQGHLAAAQLWKCLHEQVTAVFHAILTAREGIFALVDRGPLELPDAPLAVSTQQLLMDGIRRIDELGLFRTRIPGPEAYLRRRQPRRPVALQPLEQRLLDLVDGRRRLAEVAAEAHLSEFDATKVLYHLAEAGYVEAAAEPAAVQPQDPQARVAEVTAGMNAIFREVAVHLAARRAMEPVASAVRGYLAEAGGRYAPLWKGVAPGRDLALDPACLAVNLSALQGPALVRLEPTGEPARLLFDALRELLFFILFQAGERLEREADEGLSTEVKRRLEALGGLR
jgi:hypothetical protein